jgi:hypothetical protein
VIAPTQSMRVRSLQVASAVVQNMCSSKKNPPVVAGG